MSTVVGDTTTGVPARIIRASDFRLVDVYSREEYVDVKYCRVVVRIVPVPIGSLGRVSDAEGNTALDIVVIKKVAVPPIIRMTRTAAILPLANPLRPGLFHSLTTCAGLGLSLA